MRILAIETSCDETAAAVIEKNGSDVKILSNVVASQINIHKKYGGVFPEIASRAHAEKIISVVEKALEDAGMSPSEVPVGSKRNSSSSAEISNRNYRLARAAENEEISRSRIVDIDTFAVTTGPGLIGSLLIGVNFAKTLAYKTKKPIIPINHWLGHIYSNFVATEGMPLSAWGSSKASRLDRDPRANGASQESLPQFPALVLIVSGGHTGLVLMKSHNEIIPLGETLDDAAGEAFDKVAKLLDLGYPGGPAIAAAAARYEKPDARNEIKLPRPMLDRKDYNFSFSGLKTAVLYKLKEITQNSPRISQSYSDALASEFQQAVCDILIGKTIQAAYEFKPKSICACGGVSANKELREQMKKAVFGLPWNPTFHIPQLSLTTDNAAMVGVAAAYHLDQKTTWDKISADSNLRI